MAVGVNHDRGGPDEQVNAKSEDWQLACRRHVDVRMPPNVLLFLYGPFS